MSDLDDWNRLGRDTVRHNSEQITAFHEGQKDRPDLKTDPRTPELAQRVLDQVIALNDAGRGTEARASFDPAHAPFIAELEKGGRGLKFCAILGEDEFLVQQGTAWQETTTWRISGERITKVENVAGFAWSRNRAHFVTLYKNGGLTVGTSFDADVAQLLPHPAATDFVPHGLTEEQRAQYTIVETAAVTDLAVSDDGQSVLITDEARGVLLLRNTGDGWERRLLYPSLELGLAEDLQNWFIEESDPYRPFLDMLHAALSPDGRFVALGTQDAGHHVLDVSDEPRRYAKLGHLSEYPHYAWFSDDSKVVAFNSCHFYNGATFASELLAIEGIETEPYEQHQKQTLLNPYLRVYAAGFLPASMTSDCESGAFLLAGSGFASCVTPGGDLLWELGFGSSAGGVDICPKTGRVLLASFSGMLHLFDPARTQEIPIHDGYKVPEELRRWVFWDRLRRPLIW